MRRSVRVRALLVALIRGKIAEIKEYESRPILIHDPRLDRSVEIGNDLKVLRWCLGIIDGTRSRPWRVVLWFADYPEPLLELRFRVTIAIRKLFRLETKSTLEREQLRLRLQIGELR